MKNKLVIEVFPPIGSDNTVLAGIVKATVERKFAKYMDRIEIWWDRVDE